MRTNWKKQTAGCSHCRGQVQLSPRPVNRTKRYEEEVDLAFYLLEPDPDDEEFEGDMATHLVERHLLDGVSRNLAAAQEVAGSLDWQWFVTAVETVSFEQELSQAAQASPTSAATLPPSTVPSRTTSKATTEAEVSLLALLHLELR